MNYDAVLYQIPLDAGLTAKDYNVLLCLITNGDDSKTVESISYSENNAFAIGFITEEAAHKISFKTDEQSAFGKGVCEILGDVNKETRSQRYEIEGLNVLIIYRRAANEGRYVVVSYYEGETGDTLVFPPEDTEQEAIALCKRLWEKSKAWAEEDETYDPNNTDFDEYCGNGVVAWSDDLKRFFEVVKVTEDEKNFY